jgi:peptide/nickel transport system permease protein
MRSYLAMRVIYSAFTVFGVLVVVFFVLRLSGDPVGLMVPEGATLEDVAALRRQLGFDQPVYVQFALFLGRAVRGDFGVSLGYQRPAMALVVERLPATAELAIPALLLSICIGLPIGIITALRPHAWYSNAGMLLALLGQSVPSFWVAILLILFFAVRLGVLPTSGRGSLVYLILPSVSLAMHSMASLVRLTRSAMLEVLGEDYIRTARAKGLGERVVIFKHALRNAAIPIMTIVGLQMGALLSGAVITEMIFAWPGVGRLVIQAIYRRDFPLVQAAVVVIACIYVLINLAVDLSYVWLNPRIQYGSRR